MPIHPLVNILFYISCLVALNFLKPLWLFVAFLICCITAYHLTGSAFIKRCLRLKWLYLSIFLIYAISTPGEYILLVKDVIDITREGVLLGAMQVSKIIMALACLSIVFHQTGVSALITGLHYLLLPLTVFGLNVDRFTVRLSLTLQYVESITSDFSHKLNFLNLFHMIQSEKFNTSIKSVDHYSRQFSVKDVLALMLIFLALIALLGTRLGFIV